MARALLDGSAAQQPPMGSVPFEHQWESDVDAFYKDNVRSLYLPNLCPSPSRSTYSCTVGTGLLHYVIVASPLLPLPQTFMIMILK
jgi:hypothetical protein